MPVIQAKDQQRVNMRREQVERFLASDSTVSEWCRLNKVSESTFYKWMAYFREAEPESFAGPGRAGKWIEVSRAELAASTALAVTGPAGARVAPAAPGHATAVPVRPLDKAPAACAPAITARVNSVELSIPPGAAEADISAVMRAAMSL